MNMKLLLEIIIVVSVLLLCAVAPYHIFQSYKKRAIGTLKDYERFLVNVNEYVHGQILGVFNHSLKLYRFYNFTEPEKGGYPDIQELHEAAVAALRTFVRRRELEHDRLRANIYKLPKAEPNSPIGLLIKRAHADDLVEEARRNLDTVQSELLALKTKMRYEPRLETTQSLTPKKV